MSNEVLPVEYHLEVYEGSFGTPAYHAQTSTPLMNMSIGDRYSHLASGDWLEPPRPGERFYIRDIEHIIWEIEDSHIGHKTMVYLEKRKVD